LTDKKEEFLSPQGMSSSLGAFKDEVDKKEDVSSVDAILQDSSLGVVGPPPSRAEIAASRRHPPPLHPPNKVKKEQTDKSTASTVSLTFCCEGISSESPYGKEVVDTRDSLMDDILNPKVRKSYNQRVLDAGRLFLYVSKACQHLLKLGKDGEKYLIGLSPAGLVRAPDKVIVVISHPFLVDEGEGKGGKDRCTFSMLLYKSPEMIKEEIEKETDTSVGYTIGMVGYSLLVKAKPFHSNSDEIGIRRIVKGERPSVKVLEMRKCPLVVLITDSWKQSAEDRPSLDDVV
jgi:hypothetical protein